MNIKTKKLIEIIVLFFLVQNMYAQTAEQLPKWALNGVEMDFTSLSGVTTYSVNSYYSTANGAYNSYYDENDIRLFHIIDNKIYDGNGVFIDYLFEDNVSPQDELTGELIIVPLLVLVANEDE